MRYSSPFFVFTLLSICFILLPMFAVIRHTFDINTNDKYNSVGEWKHQVWIFDDEVDAMTYAISLLDNPLLQANEHYMAHAIETLQESKFWQVGRESVAIGEILESPKIIYKESKKESLFIRCSEETYSLNHAG